MLVALSSACTKNKIMPVMMSGRSGTSGHQGSLFPQEKIQMKLSMWKESKCSKHLSLLPSKGARAVLCGQQDSRRLVYFVCLEIVCCFWWWEQRHHSTTASCTSPNYLKNVTIEKELLWHKSVCSPKVCFVPALALMRGCLLFVVVNILANHFYFGVEIIPQHFILCEVNRFMIFLLLLWFLLFTNYFLLTSCLVFFWKNQLIQLKCIQKLNSLVLLFVWVCAISSICFQGFQVLFFSKSFGVKFRGKAEICLDFIQILCLQRKKMIGN